MSATLGDALHELAGDVGDLGDIERALREVRNRRVRIAAGVLAASCLAALLAVVSLPTPDSIVPAGPESSPPVEVLRPDQPMPSIVDAPLPDGADVAAAANGRAVVWARGSARLVASSPRLYWTSLSPDGRLLARSDGGKDLQQTVASGTGGGDELVVTDLSTGQDLLRWQMQVDGEAGQAARHVWSGDSRRLFVTVIPTNGGTSEYQPSLGELHVWQRQGQAFLPLERATALPGTLIGVDENGRRALVMDEQRGVDQPVDGSMKVLDVEGGNMWTVAQGSDYPTRPDLWTLGQGCWDAIENRVCWVGESVGQFVHLGFLSLTEGAGQTGVTWLPSSLRGFAEPAGWLDGDPVVVHERVEDVDGGGWQGSGTVDVVRWTETGPQVIRRFDASLLPKGQEISYRISVPAYQ